MSGGEKQRVALARALLKRSKIILADEPTGSLDEQNRALILGLLRQEVEKEKQLSLSRMTRLLLQHVMNSLKYRDLTKTTIFGRLFKYVFSI